MFECDDDFDVRSDATFSTRETQSISKSHRK